MTFALQGRRDGSTQRQLLADLVAQQYKRNDERLPARHLPRARRHASRSSPPTTRTAPGASACSATRSRSITEFDPLTGKKTADLELRQGLRQQPLRDATPDAAAGDQAASRTELKQRLDELDRTGRLLEAQRLEQRTIFDIEMMEATGSCAGIENYSRYLTGRKPGEPPPTFFEYIPDNALVFADESHVTVPQIGGMYRGDFRRKVTLAEYGFRLPSCIDNRPLQLRGMGRHAAADGPRLGHARRRGRWSAPAASSSSR